MGFREYVAHGWAICGIDPGQKGPLYPKWHTNPIPADAADGLDGAGLLHVLSGTCCLDLDDLSTARPWLAERGVDVDSLLAAPDGVQITSGRPDRAKLLYRLSKPLRTVKPTDSGLELRCATAAGLSVQDVLPPTVHPITKKPYRWKYAEPLLGDWRSLPTIPATLLALWRELTPAIVVPPPSESVNPKIAALRVMLEGHKPDCDYNAWTKVGMALHDGTGGSQEGLSLWNEWSAKAPAGRYKGIEDLKTHWLSFQSTPGKRVVTVASLRTEQPAAPDDFPDVTLADVAAAAEAADAQVIATAEMKRAEAVEWLERRLVYVSGAACYFDTEKHHIIASDRGVEHEFTGFMPRTKGGRLSPLKILRESRTKRVVEGVGFHPGEGPVFRSGAGKDEYVNVYRNRLPEPEEPTQGDLARIDWMFDRIDDVPFRDWLRQLFAHAVQYPGVKIKSAPLIWSETEGNGKTTLLRVIPSLLVGRTYSREVTTALLNSDFNDYLLNAWHVNLSEFRADSRGERRVISAKLKEWITEDEIALNPKGHTAYNMPNHFFVTATSNENDAAAIGNEDRRWGVHELHAKQFTVSEQQYVYHEFLSTERAAAVLRHYFLNLSLDGFNPDDKAPLTDARAEMVKLSVGAERAYLVRCFEERSGPFENDVVRGAEVATAMRREMRFNPTPDQVGKWLSKPPFNGVHRKARVGKGTVNFIIIANHFKWRDASGQELAAEAAGENFGAEIDLAS